MSGIYDVFVKISMVNGVSPVLAVIAKEVLSLEGSVKNLAKAFGEMSAAGKLAFGGVAIAASVGLASALKHVADHGDKLLDQQDKLRRSGVQQNEILRLQADYYDKVAKAVPTSTLSDYLKEFNELRSVVGGEKAAQVAPWSMQLEAIISNATGKTASGEGFKLWRALEMTGRTMSDPAGVSRLGDMFAKNIIGSGGKLDANTYQTMARRGGVAWANASPQFLAGPMSVVGADLGGDTAGTAMMSAYMFMTGANTLSKQQYETMKRMGLIDPSKVTTDKGGRINVAPGGIVGSDKYAGNGKFDLYGWSQNVLAPALANASGGDRMVADSFIAKIGRNRNVMRMLTMFTDPGFREQIEKDLALWEQTKGVEDSYKGFTNDNSKGVKKAFNEQYETMMQSIGAPLMQAAIPVMKGITEIFRAIGEFANNNPMAIKAVAGGIAGLAAALAVLGTGAVIAAAAALAPGAAVAAAVVGIATAIGTLAALNWDAVKAGFQSIIDAVSRFIAWVGSLASSLGGLKAPDISGSGINGPANMPSTGGGGSGYPTNMMPPPGKQSSVNVDTKVVLDGKQIAAAIESRISEGSMFPTRAPGGTSYALPGP